MIYRYTVGFILSLILTISAYVMVVYGSSGWLPLLLGVLAVVQMVVQLLFFLHLGEDTGHRYKLWSFVFMAGTLLIIVVGSLWIMYNMNYNMAHMTPSEKANYMTAKNEMGF